MSANLLFILKIEALSNSLGNLCVGWGGGGVVRVCRVVGITVGHSGFKPPFLLGGS